MGGSQEARHPKVCREVLYNHLALIPACLLKYPEKKKNYHELITFHLWCLIQQYPSIYQQMSAVLFKVISHRLKSLFLVYSWWSIYRFYLSQLSHCVNFLETVYVNEICPWFSHQDNKEVLQNSGYRKKYYGSENWELL